jgi:hypothetical protein
MDQRDMSNESAEHIHKEEQRLDRATSLARTWADWSRARDGERPGLPEALPPRPGVSGRIELERASCMVGAPVNGLVVIENTTDLDVEVVMLHVRVLPATCSPPPVQNWDRSVRSTPPRVPARGSVALPFVIGGTTMPRVPPALTYFCDAVVRLADGCEHELVPVSFAVHPPTA